MGEPWHLSPLHQIRPDVGVKFQEMEPPGIIPSIREGHHFILYFLDKQDKKSSSGQLSVANFNISIAGHFVFTNQAI